MIKSLSLAVAVALAAALPSFTLAATPLPSISPVQVAQAATQTNLTATITQIKGAVITVKTLEKKMYTLKFAAKASLADAKGKIIAQKALRVGHSIRATGTVKGSAFTVSRLRVASSAPTTSGAGSTTPSSQIYTLAQVATHKDATSCWSIVNGNVYDLTSWITKHPGGRGSILGICGKDGASAFQGQHGSNMNAKQTLETFKIGTLKK